MRDRIRVAARTLRKHAGFSTVVIASLALAIALNTTMYGVVDALVHPRVDIQDPQSLFRVKMFGDYHFRVSTKQRDSLVLAGARSVMSIAWYDDVSATYGAPITVGDRYAERGVSYVSLEFFRLLGARFVHGRPFAAFDVDAATKPIVISERLVDALFPPGANPIGASLKVRDSTYTVIGVVSRYSRFQDDVASAWVLGTPQARGTPQMYTRLVRVRPGTSGAELGRELDMVAARIAAATGEDPRSVAFRIRLPKQAEVNLRALHYALIVAVVAVLLVGCANVANMQLARGIARGRELAVRTALGATRSRLIAHLMTESVLLAAVGLALGLLLTFVGSALLRASIPPSVGQYIVEPRMSWRVLAFAVSATIACILMVGVAPSIKVSRVDPNELLKSGAGTGATRRHRRGYGYLVVAEIALTLGLVSAAAVMIRGALFANTMWMGYDPMHMATGYLGARPSEGTRVSLAEFLASLAERLRAMPGVVNASADMGDSFDNAGVSLADSSGVRVLQVPGYGYRIVSPSYFRTMTLPIIAGRDFRDGERDQPAVIIDEYTARKYWPNANPVGALIKLGDQRSLEPFVRIVGVVGRNDEHGKPKPADLSDFGATIGYIYYLPGKTDSITAGKFGLLANVTVRTTGNPASLLPLMRVAGVVRAVTMDDNLGLTVGRQSRAFLAKLFTLFASLGLALAAFGVYGVVAHSVAERRRELGVRIALGATARDILHAVLRESVIIALAGTAVGLLFTKYGVMLLGQFAAENDIYNAPLFAGVALFLFAAAASSAFVPALRATRVDPTESLRSE